MVMNLSFGASSPGIRRGLIDGSYAQAFSGLRKFFQPIPKFAQLARDVEQPPNSSPLLPLGPFAALDFRRPRIGGFVGSGDGGRHRGSCYGGEQGSRPQIGPGIFAFCREKSAEKTRSRRSIDQRKSALGDTDQESGCDAGAATICADAAASQANGGQHALAACPADRARKTATCAHWHSDRRQRSDRRLP